MKIENETPFAVTALPACDRNALETMTAIVQGTYRIAGPRVLELAGEQPAPSLAEEWIGVPYKPGTDVLLLGRACDPGGGKPRKVRVGLTVGRLSKKANIKSGEPLDGFGATPREAKPRRALAGTYDERWQRERAPLLPEDFDERFFLAAFPELVAVPHLIGDERVIAEGVSMLGTLDLRLPGLRLQVEVFVGREADRGPALLDTVVLEPEVEHLTLVWRRRVPCPLGIQDLRGFCVRTA
jgi:hypothetical protein